MTAASRARPIPTSELRRRISPIATIGATEILAPLPSRAWVCERLRVAGGGRVSLIVGPPAGGKTIGAQTLALAVATGRRWLGHHDVTQCRVLHLDREVGHYLTCSRYQRIARAMGVTAADIEDRLRVAIYPPLTLDQPDAEEILATTCREYGLVIIDSLAAYAGAAEEHTPEIGHLLLMLGRVSAATGAAIVVLHHTRRDGEIRGSTSIAGGAECQWRLTDVDRGRSTLVHERSPMGDPQPDITVQIVDVEVDGDPRGGLRVQLLDPPQSSTPSERPGAAHDGLMLLILDHLRRHGPCPGGAEVLAARLTRRASAVRAALAELSARGQIEVFGGKRDRQIRLLGGAS